MKYKVKFQLPARDKSKGICHFRNTRISP